MNLYLPGPHIGVSGRFVAELRGPDGLVKRRVSTDNVITDVGLADLGYTKAGFSSTRTIGNLTSALGVGTGTTPATTNDTALGSLLAIKNAGGAANNGAGATSGYKAGPPHYYSQWIAATFAQTEANGIISELGSFSGIGTSRIMFSRALLKDAAGNPTTLTKTSIDQLTIYWELRMTLPAAADTVTNLTIDGVATTVTGRPFAMQTNKWDWSEYGAMFNFGSLATNVNALAKAMEAVVAPDYYAYTQFSGETAAENLIIDPYVAGSQQRVFGGTWGPTTANFATGIGSLVVGVASFLNHYWYGFNPKVMKNNTHRFTFKHRISWGRA